MKKALLLPLLCLLHSTAAFGQAAPTPPPATPPAPAPPTASRGPQPFGASLFQGNFLRQRADGNNPDYVVMPGDRVALSTWGAVELNEVLVVDGQGNVFLPGIGPVQLAGQKNRDLTKIVRAHIGKVYRANFGVYTNLLSAAPVGVFVTGGVVRPGRYAGVPSDSLLFFLDQAGGIDPELGSYRHIRVLRDGKQLVEADLYAFILRGELPNVQFVEGDTVLVGQRGPVVEVKGAAAERGLIELAGPEATGAEVLQVIPQQARATEVTLTGLRGGQPVASTLSLTQFERTPVRGGDVLELREDGRSETILVQLEGEFEGPSVLSVRRGARLLDLLNHVPVRPELANTDAVHIKRKSVARAQRKAIEDSLFRLERSALLALSKSNGEAQIRVKEAELTKTYVERARLIQPVGRVVTARNGRQQNLLLEDGDIVVIPALTTVVRVSGEVQLTQALTYAPTLRVRDYVQMAGGYTERADDDHVIILHASAEVTMGDEDSPVRPGDEILVLPRIDRKRLQNAADILQLIYQVAFSSGVVLNAVNTIN